MEQKRHKQSDPITQFAWVTKNVIRLRQAIAYKANIIEEPTLEDLQQEAHYLRRMLETNLAQQQLHIQVGTTSKGTSKALQKLTTANKSMLRVAEEENRIKSPFN
jgi:hypothetical protein